MAKLALLIGVSEYQSGLNPLPAAVGDVEEMRRVLVNPKMGGFADGDITVLKNPQPQDIRDAIFYLFADRQKDDLLLFYFSGHGIKDDRGNLYFSTRATAKYHGKLVKPSAVAASYLHESINDSRSQRQIIILDCCFSGAIAQGMTVKDDGSVNVQEQLGGKGRAILTSSTSTQYAFEQEGSELSIYTRYLVEGIDTGAADKDGDGWISIDELHEYASSKVQEASPAMTPKFYPVEEGHKILLAKSPKDDPKLKYRKEFTKIAQEDEGEIAVLSRFYLDELCDRLGLSPEDAKTIESEVLQPYHLHQEKLRRYEQALSQIVQHQYPLSEKNRLRLQRLQNILHLRDKDIADIEKRVLAPKQVEYEPQQQEAERLKKEQEQQEAEKRREEYENNRQLYEQELLKAIQAQYPLNEFLWDGLKSFQQSLGLRDEDVARIEKPILEKKEVEYQEKLRQQEEALILQRQRKQEEETEKVEQKQETDRAFNGKSRGASKSSKNKSRMVLWRLNRFHGDFLGFLNRRFGGFWGFCIYWFGCIFYGAFMYFILVRLGMCVSYFVGEFVGFVLWMSSW